MSFEKKYEITYDECLSKINEWGNVCSMCGGDLSPLETVDNGGNSTFWAGCKSCCVFENGVDPFVYKVARKYAEEDKLSFRKEHEPYDFFIKNRTREACMQLLSLVQAAKDVGILIKLESID